MNVLLDFARNRIPIKELDIETVYIGKNESSHFNPLKDSFRIYKEILKFSASSLVGFLVDYAIFSILVALKLSITPANVIARVVSSSVNFTINRKFVFHNKDSVWKSAIKYFLLATFILIGNTFVLNLLVHKLSVNSHLAKIITEVFFYIISWLVQRLFVFKRSKSTEEGHHS
jgi:putative flippase GtrA